MNTDVAEVLYGGAKGGGKSVFGVYWLYTECYEIARKYFAEPPKYPVPVAWMGRKQRIDFTNTTLETWKQFIPPERYELREQQGEIVIAGRVKIDYGGFDRSEDVRKFNSAAYARIFVDQAEEITQDEAAFVRATVNRPVGKVKIPGKILWTANPAQCWLKPEFIDKQQQGLAFVRALPADNPYLDATYISQLQRSFAHRPELLEAYLYGSWDSLEGSDQIIQGDWIRKAANRVTSLSSVCRKLITCDPARFGDDETVIYYLEDGQIMDSIVYGQQDTMHTVGEICRLARLKGEPAIAIDVIGVGAGIVDRLREMEKDVIAVNASEKSIDPEHYVNLRAEMWDSVARQFSDGLVTLGMKGKLDERLQHELSIPHYKFKNGKMQVEEKDEIKKRLGCSPDRADAYIQGLWAMQFAQEGVGQGVAFVDKAKIWGD